MMRKSMAPPRQTQIQEQPGQLWTIQGQHTMSGGDYILSTRPRFGSVLFCRIAPTLTAQHGCGESVELISTQSKCAQQDMILGQRVACFPLKAKAFSAIDGLSLQMCQERP